MKWIFYVIVFIYMFYRAVYGAKTKETDSITIDAIKYDGDRKFLLPGVRKNISCTAAKINHKVEWINPMGKAVKRIPSNRVFVQENFVSLLKSHSVRGRARAQVLVFSGLTVEDSGVWQCQAGGYNQSVSLCVIDPSEFVDTPTEVPVDSGRSITLSCQAKGNPEPRVLWYRDGEILSDDVNSSKYQIMTKYNSQGFEGLLTIMSLEAEDSGAYTCAAIQESPLVDDCNHQTTLNISLQVNHAPTFKDGNYSIIYATEGESVELVCSATGFPIPAYKWFEDNDDHLNEIPQTNIRLADDGAEAFLTLEPNSYNWNQKFKCSASNKYGEEVKSFLLVKTQRPRIPNHINPLSESGDKIQLQLTWKNELDFPVDSVHVQYLLDNSFKGGKPKESDWVRSKIAKLKPDNVDDMGLNVTLGGLHEDTKYFIRIRLVNRAGVSFNSKVFTATTAMEYESEDPEELDETEEPEDLASTENSTFFGIFFAGAIIICAVGFVFLMKMV